MNELVAVVIGMVCGALLFVGGLLVGWRMRDAVKVSEGQEAAPLAVPEVRMRRPESVTEPWDGPVEPDN